MVRVVTCGCHVGMSRDEQRLRHLRMNGYTHKDDAQEVTDALLALSELGCHGDDMLEAGRVLRARPSVGEFLVLSEGTARRFFHCCLFGDDPKWTAARVVWVAPAVQS